MFGRTYFLSNPHFLSHGIWHQMKELFGELHFSQIICHHQFFLVSYMFGDLHFTQSICRCKFFLVNFIFGELHFSHIICHNQNTFLVNYISCELHLPLSKFNYETVLLNMLLFFQQLMIGGIS